MILFNIAENEMQLEEVSTPAPSVPSPTKSRVEELRIKNKQRLQSFKAQQEQQV